MSEAISGTVLDFSRMSLRSSGLRAQALLLHAELDRFNGIWWIHGIVLRFIGVDQGRQYIEPVALRSPALCAPKALNLRKCVLVVRLGADRFEFSRHVAPRLRHCRLSACSTNRAAASASASAPYLAITCTPTGNSPSAMSAGTLTQGTPISVHSRL